MLIALPKVAQSSGYLISPKALAVLNSEGIWVLNSSHRQDGHQGRNSSNREKWKEKHSEGYKEETYVWCPESFYVRHGTLY